MIAVLLRDWRSTLNGGIGVVRVAAERHATHYLVTEIESQIGGRGFIVWRLGTKTPYHIRLGCSDPSCECLGWLAHGKCKHMAAMTNLLRVLEGDDHPTEFQRPLMPQKTEPDKSEASYAAWGLRHDRCQCCGNVNNLTTHHIVKQGRSHEYCNLLRLCIQCHDLAEMLTVRVWGMVLPCLRIEHCLWLKRRGDPDEYDPCRLQVLRGAKLPEPVRPPLLDILERLSA